MGPMFTPMVCWLRHYRHFQFLARSSAGDCWWEILPVNVTIGPASFEAWRFTRGSLQLEKRFVILPNGLGKGARNLMTACDLQRSTFLTSAKGASRIAVRLITTCISPPDTRSWTRPCWKRHG